MNYICWQVPQDKSFKNISFVIYNMYASVNRDHEKLTVFVVIDFMCLLFLQIL